MIVRPMGLMVEGRLELGLELVIEDGSVVEIRPHTGVPESFVVSPAFVNAHSHLEYRGLQGKVGAPEYWGWIRELTALKSKQTMHEVRGDCLLAAEENRKTGVALIAEHSDRPFAGEAMSARGLGGAIFQEVITAFDLEGPDRRMQAIRESLLTNASAFGGSVWLSPHAHFTVDDSLLSALGASGDPISIHVAETRYESQLTRNGEGPIAATLKDYGVQFESSGLNVIETLLGLGIARRRAQFVHCCALEEGDIEIIARAGVTVAHCPRSNERLQCPVAPVRRLNEAGIALGLGLDSAASGGPIDMFAEMRAALRSSGVLGEPLTPEQVWNLATTAGFDSIRPLMGGEERSKWSIEVGSRAPLIGIRCEGIESIEDLIESGSPDQVFWL